MGGNGCIPCGTSQVLTVFIGDVLTSAVLVALGKTEIDDVDLVTGGLGGSDQEVVWLDIAMDNSLSMNFLEVLHELDGDEENGLHVQLPLA